MDWFALVLLFLGGICLLGSAIALVAQDTQFALGLGIFGGVLVVCGGVAKAASMAGDSVEGHAAKKPKTRLQTMLISGGWLAYLGGAVIYNWGSPGGYVMLAIWLFSGYFFLRFVRANEFHSGDLLTLQWEGWFHAARVLESFDGGYLIRLFTERASVRPPSLVPATLTQMELDGRSMIVSISEEFLMLCEPELIHEGELSEGDLDEIFTFFAYSNESTGYARSA